MDKDAKMLRALAEDSVVNTGGISAELVEEMNSKLDAAVVARITQDVAFNNPLVTKDGETRVDLGIQKAAIEAALQRPPAGIETAMLPPADSQPQMTQRLHHLRLHRNSTEILRSKLCSIRQDHLK